MSVVRLCDSWAAILATLDHELIAFTHLSIVFRISAIEGAISSLIFVAFFLLIDFLSNEEKIEETMRSERT